MCLRYWIYSLPHGFFKGGITKDIAPPIIVSAFVYKNLLIELYEDDSI